MKRAYSYACYGRRELLEPPCLAISRRLDLWRTNGVRISNAYHGTFWTRGVPRHSRVASRVLHGVLRNVLHPICHLHVDLHYHVWLLPFDSAESAAQCDALDRCNSDRIADPGKRSARRCRRLAVCDG